MAHRVGGRIPPRSRRSRSSVVGPLPVPGGQDVETKAVEAVSEISPMKKSLQSSFNDEAANRTGRDAGAYLGHPSPHSGTRLRRMTTSRLDAVLGQRAFKLDKVRRRHAGGGQIAQERSFDNAPPGVRHDPGYLRAPRSRCWMWCHRSCSCSRLAAPEHVQPMARQAHRLVAIRSTQAPGQGWGANSVDHADEHLTGERPDRGLGPCRLLPRAESGRWQFRRCSNGQHLVTRRSSSTAQRPWLRPQQSFGKAKARKGALRACPREMCSAGYRCS